MDNNNGIHLTTRQNIIQFLKFTLFSASAGLIQLGSCILLHEVGHLEYWLSYLIALILSVIYNFTINRRFTFKSVANIPIALLKVFGYYCVFTPLSTWWVDRLDKIGWNEYIILGGTMLINFVTEFTFTRFVVYKNNINTNELGLKENEKYKKAFSDLEADTINM